MDAATGALSGDASVRARRPGNGRRACRPSRSTTCARSIDRITRRRTITPVAAGGVDDAFRSRLAKDFAAGLPAGKAAVPDLPAPAEPRDLELTIVEKPTIATAISLGFPLDVTRADDDFYALAVAGSAFGEHRTFNGRLMKNMRGKRGLNYGDYAYIENFIQDGGQHVSSARRAAAAAVLLDLDSARAARQGGVRLAAGGARARSPGQGRSDRRGIRSDAQLPVPLQQAVGADAVAPRGLRPGRPVLRPREPGRRTGPPAADA